VTIDLAPGRGPGLRLRHPVIVAAGGGGYGNELLDAVGELAPAALVTRSLTLEPDPGHRPPRMVSLEDGLLTSIGTPSPGLSEVLRRQGPRWSASDVPVIVSVCADRADDIAAMVRMLEAQPGVAAIELNLACPDRGRGGTPLGLDVETSESATVLARAATELPLLAKLTALAPDIRAIARAVAAAGADAIALSAPLPAIVLDDDGRPRLGTTYGWISGPALKPQALRAVWEAAQAVRVPIVGIGGVHRLVDVIDYLSAGATAVGLATAALAEPELPGRLALELHGWCAAHGLAGPGELVGRGLPRRPDRGSLRLSRSRRTRHS
jgi:dihydroorotate dehydrogenase (NAD+) catalytic subunit